MIDGKICLKNLSDDSDETRKYLSDRKFRG